MSTHLSHRCTPGDTGLGLVGSSTVAEAQLPPELVTALTSSAKNLGIPVCVLSRFDTNWQTLASALPGSPPCATVWPLAWGLCQRVMDARASVVVEDAYLDPALVTGLPTALPDDGPPLRSFAGVPVLVEGAAVGVVCAISPVKRPFTAAEMALLEHCADGTAAWFADNREAVVVSLQRQGDTELVRLLIGDRWRVTGRAGAGGQSDVWLARELGSGRDVAVKIATTSGHSVIREARAFSMLRHVSLINVHAAGILPDGREYAVMEYVDGEPFAEHVVADGAVDLDLLLDRLGSVAGALTALHAAGWVHGDVKCANILVDRARDRAVLIDLGLGISLGEPMARRGGTPGVSAPEQFDRSRPPIDRAADVYGLAMTFTQVITGHNPFLSADLDCGVIEAQRRGLRPDPLLTDRRYAALEPVLRWALHPDPKKRQRSPLTLLLELRQAAYGFPNGRPPPNGIAMEVLQAVFNALSPEQQESPALAPIRTVLEDGGTYVTMDVWSDFLATFSGGLPETVHEVVARSVRARGRQRIRASHLSFDPQPVVESMLEHFDYYLPVYQLELYVTDGKADGFVDLDANHVPLLQAHFATFFSEMIAFTGATGETTWSRRTRHRWAVTFRWYRS